MDDNEHSYRQNTFQTQNDLKKYSPMMELTSFAVQYAEAMAQSTGLFVCITDRDQVIAVAGGLSLIHI